MSEGQDNVISLKPLLAFHGELAVQQKYLNRVRAHAAADELVQGFGYWEDGKGCAVGCTLHSADHAAYETELGIPRALAHLEDRIFENLPVDEARTWPERFLAAPKLGADLTRVPWQMIQWLLSDEWAVTKNAEIVALRESLLVLFQPMSTGQPLDQEAFRAFLPQAREIRDRAWAVRRKAWSDYHAALDRRAVVAEAAAAVAAAVAVAAVAEAAEAAEAAAAAVAVAVAVAAAVAEAVAAVAAWHSAYFPARKKAFVTISEKLLEFMAAA